VLGFLLLLRWSIRSGYCVPALPYDLTFPEVFYPTGVPHGRRGFHAVLGNPPWDALQPLGKEFFARYDLRILDAPTRRERAEIEVRLTNDLAVQDAFKQYATGFQKTKAFIDRLYGHVNRSAGGKPSGAITDVWQAFSERGLELLRHSGQVGFVLPAATRASMDRDTP